MTPRARFKVTPFLLASTALLTVASMSGAVAATPLDRPLVMAQAATTAPVVTEERKKPAEAPAARPARPQPPAAPQAKPPQAPAAAPAQPRVQAPPPAAAPARPAPAAQERRQEQRQEQRQERREDRANDRRPAQPAQAPAAQPSQPQTAPTATQPATRQPPAAAQERRDERREDRRDGRRDDRNRPAPSTAQPQQAPATTAPATAQQPATTQPPAATQDRRDGRRDERRDGRRDDPRQQTPSTAQQPQQAPAATMAPPTQARDAREFIRRDGQGPSRGIGEVRQERRESREGNRTVIRERDRTIIREGDRTIIRHNESNRFAISARNVRTERRGANTETIVERGNGVRIVTITDSNGRLLRRVRRDARNRDVVIINNNYAGRGAALFVQLAPPVIRMPRERYIVEADRAGRDDFYAVFSAPPVEMIDQPYTLDQVRYSAPLRDRMPRVDLDVTFETGSWQLSPEEVEKLAAVADGLNRALEQNPGEVFLIEGHTDAVGQDFDNLSLSDRRAESVAVALTEQFQVPAENLVTQGYGEQYLKVPTEGPERTNRRVSVRRITPLMNQQARNAPPPR